VQPAELQRQLEFLVGTSCALPDNRYFDQVASEVDSLDDTTFDLLTRILIAAGQDRVGEGFFDFFKGLGQSYEDRVTEWRKRSMRRYGNFRFAFNELRGLGCPSIEEQLSWKSRGFDSRAAFGDGLKPIPSKDAPLLGYLAGGSIMDLKARQSAGADLNEQQLELIKRFEAARNAGVHNTYEYACTPWLDVYVATSMRTSEEFYAVGRLLESVFIEGVNEDSVLKKVGYFDPTQSFHDDRIVKGLVEGLMLKRAACTLYLAQETDTLGKDSELAITLAQGKPVIAYVPAATELSVEGIISDLKTASELEADAEDNELNYSKLVDRFAQLLSLTNFRQVWEELNLEDGISTEAQFNTAAERFTHELIALYERRAQTLLTDHPLALQINLDTGVANGILVARTPKECRELILDVLKLGLNFEIHAKDPAPESRQPQADLDCPIAWDRYLVEQRTKSVHRVVIADPLISNAFWNWYFDNVY
jgi:hypothetical protein